MQPAVRPGTMEVTETACGPQRQHCITELHSAEHGSVASDSVLFELAPRCQGPTMLSAPMVFFFLTITTLFYCLNLTDKVMKHHFIYVLMFIEQLNTYNSKL